MTCRDVRGLADSFLCDELLTETNHEILRHLDTCPSCRAEIEARRRLRGALHAAFDRAPDLQARAEFAAELREHLREAAAHGHRSRTISRRWFALAAGVALAVGLTGAVFLMDRSMFGNRSSATTEALVRDAIGDHRNCALKFRLERRPVPLEDAARSDSAFRLLLDTPPDDISTPGGPAHVVERHACIYDARRFGHVVIRYRGRVVSLLMTATDALGTIDNAAAIPQPIGRPIDGLSVVAVSGTHHAILLVGDLDSAELTQLSRAVSTPLAQRLAEGLIPVDHMTLVSARP